MYQSIATINAPEFINLQPLDINPLMSSCDIKVFYLGENRNGSFISKQVATEMAKTLRGAPIVGYYKKDKEDFADHGEQVIFDDEGIHFNCLTKPYGFVSPDAKVWFKDFQDSDEFGNTIIRTYLMTTGYLWTGQFEQAATVLSQGGKPHSMELDEKSLKGHWAKNVKNNIEFFIINDAIFSKLCILGDEVEPCFEGSSITPPQISSTFKLDDNFSQTLFSMMKDLKDALKGGLGMANNKINVSEENAELINPNFVKEEDKQKEKEEEKDKEKKEYAKEEDKQKEEEEKDKEKKEYTKEEEDKQKEEKSSENDKDSSQDKEEKEEEKKKYTALKDKYDTLSQQYSFLEKEIGELRAFKEEIENKEKDALISQFNMLSDEDKEDVINNKSKYSLEEIKAKLAVICFDKKVNFNLNASSENDNLQKVVTLNMADTQDSTPDWVKAVEFTMNKL